jgi:LysM repeat protein
MTLRNLAPIAISIGILAFVWLAAVQVAPFVSASPLTQATVALATSTSPQTPVATVASPASEAQSYVVQSGDTLWSISAKFYGNGSKYPQILRANDMPDNAVLQVGITLVIPALSDTSPAPLPKSSSTPSATTSRPSPAPSQTLAGGQVATPSAFATPTSVAGEAPSISEPPKNGAATPLLTYLGLLIDVLSAICLLGSLTCAFLSIDAYRHSKRYVQRDYIRKRIRVKV